MLELLVEEGDSVKQGQLLARVDAAHSRLQLREAEADLQRRKNDVERGEKLLARKLIAATTHDQSESDYAVRRADVALARVVVAKSEIRAPFDGIVTRRWIKQGQLLAANDNVFDVADFNDLRADLRVPERDAVALAAGQPVDFTVDALGNRHFDASIERVAPIVDRESGTVKVTVRVDNRDRSLRPGLFTRMDIAFLHLANAVLMPKAAVLGSRDAEIAYVIVDGKAQRTPIRTGYENGKRIQVLDGVDVRRRSCRDRPCGAHRWRPGPGDQYRARRQDRPGASPGCGRQQRKLIESSARMAIAGRIPAMADPTESPLSRIGWRGELPDLPADHADTRASPASSPSIARAMNCTMASLHSMHSRRHVSSNRRSTRPSVRQSATSSASPTANRHRSNRSCHVAACLHAPLPANATSAS